MGLIRVSRILSKSGSFIVCIKIYNFFNPIQLDPVVNQVGSWVITFFTVLIPIIILLYLIQNIFILLY